MSALLQVSTALSTPICCDLADFFNQKLVFRTGGREAESFPLSTPNQSL